MGEVVVSSEEMDLELQDAAETEKKTTDASVIRWEKFLPKMVLRVLLVEADDSTRQIIAALLRKCSYKVAAVPDGLKAWELLKGKAHNIDLILTEVDLPSISGYALLTLIMEHDVCKNIPVIMMSSNDSVSTVYKCMLRGAADFLVKPVRKNELRNLWQHVWRRQSSTREGRNPQDESVAQQKLEGTSENNAASNPSSGGVACTRRYEKSTEKESEDESSCTKPELEADKVCTDKMQCELQHKQNESPVSDRNIQKQIERPNSSSNMELDDDWGLVVPPRRNSNEMCNVDDLSLKSPMEPANLVSEVCDNNASFVKTSREAIDLIAAFDYHQSCSHRNSGSTIGTNKVDSSVLLDLTLRQSPPSGQVHQFSDERHTLNHSAGSAFSWYVNKPWQPMTLPASICSQQKDCENQQSSHDRELNSGYLDFTANSQKNKSNLATDQPREAEVNLHYPQQTRVSIPIPVRGLRFERLCTPYGSVGPPILRRQSDIPSLQSPTLACHEEPSIQVNSFRPSSNLETGSSQKFHNTIDQSTNNSTNLTELTQKHMSEFSENQVQFSSATDPSATNSVGHANSIGCISKGNTDHVSVGRTSAESANKEGASIPDRNCSKSALREAALQKFRLKRKERCFEKKVRYESRKKLAEQRPRVKGQFVRQQQMEALPADTDSNCGNSLVG